jgi:hypothetical protein
LRPATGTLLFWVSFEEEGRKGLRIRIMRLSPQIGTWTNVAKTWKNVAFRQKPVEENHLA